LDFWAATVGQPGFEFVFQQSELPAGRLPGEVAMAGGGGEAVGLGQIAKHLEGLQLHGGFYAKNGRRRQPVNGPERGFFRLKISRSRRPASQRM
jgi:hypothetical protein